MRFRVLGSGSRGNATLIDSGNTRLLLDNGFTLKETEQRAGLADFELASLDAILVTHEHSDHIKGVGALARRYQLPVYATKGTLRAGRIGRLGDCRTFSPHQESFTIGDIRVQPVPVPHDAREPCQFVFSCRSKQLGVLTDLGHITPLISQRFSSLDMLMLECNHDVRMLAEGPYPPALQARVGGRFGHLNNTQAMSLLEQVDQGRLQQLVLAHLSEKNNHPQKVSECLSGHFADCFAILKQDQCSDWFAC